MNALYIRHSLAAAWRIFTLDRTAIREFDHSFEGFFRSFYAALLSLPFYAVMLYGQQLIDADSAGAVDISLSHYLALETVSYVAHWTLFPLAMIPICKLIGAERGYVPYIIAYNWGTLIIWIATAVPYALLVLGLISKDALDLTRFAVTAFAFTYRWLVARDGLQVTPFTATGIVVFHILLYVLAAYGLVALDQGLMAALT